jgi:hypothetical protein
VADMQEVEAQGGEHLVVARAPEVDAAARLADALREPPLERGLGVFLLERDRPHPLGVLGGEAAQPGRDRLEVVARQQAAIGEHLGVRDRSRNLERHQPLVEAMILARGVVQDLRVERLALIP